MSTRLSNNEYLQRQIEDFFRETGKDRATTKEIAIWAIQTERWDPPTDLIIRKCRDDFSRAMREEYFKDENGRSIRAKHAARIDQGATQLTFWADIRVAPREHIEIAFQQRREQIVGECRQLKKDADYFNAHNTESLPLQLCFDFRDDIEEGEFDSTYPRRDID